MNTPNEHPYPDSPGDELEQIAVVGLAGRLPGAPDLDAFWRNLCDGKESLRRFSEQELADLGIPQAIYQHPDFVPMGTDLADMDRFDARLFGYTPRQAEMIDPQARIFLETCYGALENAGYDPFRFDQPIGVFAGSSPNDYAALLDDADLTDPAGSFDRLIGMEKDFLATRVSHRLNLTGPAMNVQTACSTSLVAVHLACQSLLSHESTMALAGGVSINLRTGTGYLYQPGMILSPDGHCRAFDEQANGTTLGQGCGVVVLKRLSEAVQDGDTIHAVIKATAINNDGSAKISYTAPSEDGQAEVIATALSLAGVTGDDITYVETHGTGTALGDPIEISALSRAFRAGSDRVGYCAIGSVKTNIGHTDAAAGVTGLIKTVLSLEHAQIPASLHFEQPNPKVPFQGSPFFVNTQLRPWQSPGPRRAGVSSFGIGGTNAHAVLEEPPVVPPSAPSTGLKLLPLSARTATAVATMATNLAAHLDAHDDINLADVAFTLQLGRAQYPFRSFVVADQAASAAEALRGRVISAGPAANGAKVAFMFPGQGAQYAGMAQDLYQSVPSFRDDVDRCAAILAPHLDRDIRQLLFPSAADESAVSELLRQTAFTQPALFTIEWSLARLFLSWGVQPDALIGHSIGEYAAATLAGIFTLENALVLVATRGRLMQAMPAGTMLAVQAAPADVQEMTIDRDVELAASNSSRLAVVSGEPAAIAAFAVELGKRNIVSQELHTSHAFHSRMMDPIVDEFAREVAKAAPQPPQIAMLSNVTGTWLTAEQAVDPSFWASQIRRPVRFAENVTELLARESWVFIEMGPGQALATFVRQNEQCPADAHVVTSVRHPKLQRADLGMALEALGRLWLAGIEPDWKALAGEQSRRRVVLPGYPFERETFWAPAIKSVMALDRSKRKAGQWQPPTIQAPIEDWYYVPTWRRARPCTGTATGRWLVFAHDDPLSEQVIARLTREAGQVNVVRIGPDFAVVGANDFVLNPQSDTGYDLLFTELKARGALPDAVVHLWMAQDEAAAADSKEALTQGLNLGVHSVLGLTRALGKQDAIRPVRLELVVTGTQSVLGTEGLRPEASALLGPCKVIPLEYSNMAVRVIDLQAGDGVFSNPATLVAELRRPGGDPIVALRGGYRWLPGVEAVHLGKPSPDQLALRQGGVYLIVGGLGGVGLSVAEYLAEHHGARLALLGRSGRPDPDAADADEEVRRRAEALSRIEARADQVMVIQADILDEAGLRQAVAQAEATLGSINGVLVAAAVLDNAGSIHSLTRERLEHVVGTKVFGSLVMSRVFAERKLDFLVFSSSMSTQLYHNRFGQVCYVTGNSFVEAVPLSRDWQGTQVTTVAWDDFLQYGMSIRAANAFAERTRHGEVSLMERVHSFTPTQGGIIFERCVSAGFPQVYISTTDLAARIEHDAEVESPFLAHALSNASQDATSAAETADVAGLVTRVWRELLGYETLAEGDDFFALGGDSLQVARMADRLGALLAMPIPLNLIFEAPTIARFAKRIEQMRDSGADQVVADQGPVTGAFVLSPAQRRFLDRGSANPNRWNVSILLEPSWPLAPDLLNESFAYLHEHHDAMRLRIFRDGEAWAQECVAPIWHDTWLEQVDLSRVPANEQAQRIGEHADTLHSSLDLAAGPVIRVALFDLGQTQQRLLVVMHHMVTDRVSLFRLLDDVQVVYSALVEGRRPELPPKSTSFKQWTQAFVDYAGSELARQELDQWLSLPWPKRKPLPRDFDADRQSNTNASARAVVKQITWPGGLPTSKGEAPRLDEAALASLSLAVAQWSDAPVAAIDGVGHGRRTFDAPIDVSRTVGFFFTYGTVLVDVDQTARADVIKQIRTMTPRSWTLEALRYMGRSDERLPDKAEVLFNYVGREIASDTGVLLKPVPGPKGRDHDPDGLRDHLLAVLVEIVGDDTIEARFVYSDRVHREATIEAVAQRFVDILTDYLPMKSVM